jgi:hypothetical protein
MKKSDWISDFVAELQHRAEDRRAEGAPSADVYARVASELETRRRAYLHSTPTIQEASDESGYSPEQLRKLKRDKLWSGQRIDLPRRPGKPLPESRGLTLAGEVLARAGRSH